MDDLSMTDDFLDENPSTGPKTENNTRKTKVEFEKEIEKECSLLYNVTDRTPLHLTVFFALQQALLSLSGSLATSLLVAEISCVGEDAEFKAELLSSTFFMNGITTILMVTLGIRLPLFQGPAPDYVIPLLAMQAVNKNKCSLEEISTDGLNGTAVMGNSSIINMNNGPSLSVDTRKALYMNNIRELQGCLLLAGIIHCMIGVTGCVGLLLKVIGPVTIVPTVLLTGIYFTKVTTKFAKSHWGISSLTAAVSFILSLYLGKKKMPIPIWTKQKGFHILWYPLHQVFSILIAMLVGWVVCGILTTSGALTYNKESPEYESRTDARLGVIEESQWFFFPYPGQFGPPGFNVGIFFGFLIATFNSILDSIGDYYACARMCNVPPPPAHGVNRGIAVEGFCSAISGAIGCGHATSTYGGNIGAIGVTRVASRDVFIGVGIIYLLFGIVGKISAVFITIPHSVLGGAMIVMYGMFNGVVLSNLQALSLTSTRNLAIIGTSILVGLMVPNWIETEENAINTGDVKRDSIIKMLLVNPNLAGGLLACFLDNTVPGTKHERGLTEWQMAGDTDVDIIKTYSQGYSVYQPLLPATLLSKKFIRYIPLFPKPKSSGE